MVSSESVGELVARDRSLIVSRVFHHAKIRAQADALIAGDIHITYSELARRITAVAVGWQKQGLQRPDIIVLAAESTPTFAYAYLAAHLLGIKVVPEDPAAPARRIADIADRIRPKAIYVTSQFKGGDLACRPLVELEAASLERVDSLVLGSVALPTADAVADILFTTGTTGAAKGVQLSHANISAAADSINAFVGNTENDREVIPLPLSHSFGLGRLRCVLSAGGTLVLVNGFMFPEMIFDAMSTERATGFSFVPAGLAVLLRLTEDRLGEFAQQLSYIEIGSAPMPMEHKHRLIRLLPKTRICMHYGLTEASRSAFIEFHSDREKLDTVGHPAPGVEIRIMDANGQVSVLGETGELCVRGDHVMQSYWQDERETRKAIRDGWLYTGDMGFRDAAGYIRLQGRKTEMINVGGRKVVPLEVENVLNEHSAIAECACVGVPDTGGLSGEAVMAFVVSNGDERPSERELMRFLRDRLEPYKCPVKYAWVDEIPKTSSGKLQRQILNLVSGKS